MKAIWVLENIKERESFYNKFELLLLFSSVSQWKKHHPEHTCVFYCDQLTKDFILKLNALSLWDEVNVIGKNKFIDKSVFWASSKLQVLSTVKEPVVIIDNDFIVYKPLDKYFTDKVIATHYEDGSNYYINNTDPYIKQAKHIINRPNLNALNVSLLYLPDPKFTKYYADTSLELMELFTKIKVPNSKYLIYAEQLLLLHLITLHNVSYDTLMKDKWLCYESIYIKGETGFLTKEESDLHFRHYWMDKPKIKNNEDGFSYKKEVKELENAIKIHTFIDRNELNSIK